MNNAHALEGFDMSIKLEKPIIKERCFQILTLRNFRDLIDQTKERNKMNENSFLELMRLHNEMKKKSQDPSEFLKFSDVKHIIKDYCEQKFKDIKLRDEKMTQYLRLISEYPDSENDNPNLFKAFQRIDAQIQKLIIDNTAQSTRIIEQNEELKGSLNKVLNENSFLKIKLDELKNDFGACKAQSSQLIEEVRKENAQFVTKVDFLSIKNEHHRNEIEILKNQSKEIFEQNVYLKENLYRVLEENSHIKSKSNALLLKNEEFKNEFVIIKDQSIQLTQNNFILQKKLDKIINENDELGTHSDDILYQKNSNMKAQLDMILQNDNILTQRILEFKPKLDQLPEQLNSIMLHSLLLDKIKRIKMDKNISRLHTNEICKIINYDNRMFITSSKDKTIIIRNYVDNKVVRTLTDHKESVHDLLILSNGRLASSSQDHTIKIWNLSNGNCEKTLIGHSHWVYCLIELPNSIILSGSQDSSIGIWDISQNDKNELEFYHKVKNDKQKQAYCMTLININEFAVSSHIDINIYSFNVIHKSFKIIKILNGHTERVTDIKLMNNSDDILVSCSNDKDCRLWSISQENCLKIFRGHSGKICSMQILSEKIFLSASAEIIFWNIESSEAIHTIKPDQSGKMIISFFIKNDTNELYIAGEHDFIGLIKI